MWLYILWVLEMNLLSFGMVFEEVLEPNVWDVIPEIHLSDYAAHVKQMPWFAHVSDTAYQGLNWEIVSGGLIQ